MLQRWLLPKVTRVFTSYTRKCYRFCNLHRRLRKGWSCLLNSGAETKTKARRTGRKQWTKLRQVEKFFETHLDAIFKILLAFLCTCFVLLICILVIVVVNDGGDNMLASYIPNVLKDFEGGLTISQLEHDIAALEEPQQLALIHLYDKRHATSHLKQRYGSLLPYLVKASSSYDRLSISTAKAARKALRVPTTPTESVEDGGHSEERSLWQWPTFHWPFIARPIIESERDIFFQSVRRPVGTCSRYTPSQPRHLIDCTRNDSSITNEELKYVFQPRMHNSERRELLNILEAVHQVFEANNIHYTLVQGALLGWYRCGGLLPWDDDIDLQIAYDDKQTAFEVLKALEKTYDVIMSTKRQTIYVRKKVASHFPRVEIGYRKDRLSRGNNQKLYTRTQLTKLNGVTTRVMVNVSSFLDRSVPGYANWRKRCFISPCTHSSGFCQAPHLRGAPCKSVFDIYPCGYYPEFMDPCNPRYAALILQTPSWLKLCKYSLNVKEYNYVTSRKQIEKWFDLLNGTAKDLFITIPGH